MHGRAVHVAPIRGYGALVLTVVKGTRRVLYCGPVAIAAVTGLTCAEVLRAIDELRGNPRNRGGRTAGVVGMHDDEVMRTLAVLGFSADRYVFERGVTLQRLFNEGLGEPQIMSFRDHWFAVDRTHYICSHTHGQPIPHSAVARSKRRRVVDCFIDVTRKS